MSKIANTLRMLFYLNSHRDRYVKISELADLLEVDSRQIRRYRDDLEQANFSILEARGRYGGYQLINPITSIDGIDQIESIIINLSIRNNKSVFEILNRIIPVLYTLKENKIIGENYIDDITLSKLCQIQQAKDNLKKITFKYTRYSTNSEKVYEIEPYVIKINRNIYYIGGVVDGKYKSFRVSYMADINESSSGYVIDEKLMNQLLNDKEFGISRNEKKYTVVFEVYNKSHEYICEFFDYKVELINEVDNIKTYSFLVSSPTEAVIALLSLGSNIKLISPKEIKDQYLKELESMVKRYEVSK